MPRKFMVPTLSLPAEGFKSLPYLLDLLLSIFSFDLPAAASSFLIPPSPIAFEISAFYITYTYSHASSLSI